MQAATVDITPYRVGNLPAGAGQRIVEPGILGEHLRLPKSTLLTRRWLKV